LLNPWLGISSIIVGYSLGELFRLILLYNLIKKENIKINLKATDRVFAEKFISEGKKQIISTSIVSINPLIDRFVASFLVAGSISLIDYGDKVFQIFNVLLNAFLTLVLSKWSTDNLKNELDITTVKKTSILIASGALVALILVAFLSKTGIEIIYPSFTSKEKELVALALSLNMLGFVFNSANQVINRASIVFQYTSIMITTAIYRLIFNIILDILFAFFWGIVGIIISSVIVHLIALVINYNLFNKKYNREHSYEFH